MIALKKVAPPSSDKRWKIVEATIRKHGGKGHALIEVLHKVQECFGYLDKDSMGFVAAALRLPPSRVYGAATFYHHFTLKPAGVHTCVVCLGTACYIKGAAGLIKELEEASGVTVGTTSPDGQISLLTARCLGSCGLAPAAVFDGDLQGNMTKDKALKRMEGWVAH